MAIGVVVTSATAEHEVLLPIPRSGNVILGFYNYGCINYGVWVCASIVASGSPMHLLDGEWWMHE